jgi:hypothetical protein
MSEVVRDAAQRVRTHGENQRVCYCTPSRRMMLSVRDACLNQNIPNPREVAEEINNTIGAKLQQITGHRAPMRQFDTEDTDAAYTLTDRIVRDAFEQTAQQYEAAEIRAWDAAKAAWEKTVRAAAEPPVRHQEAGQLDPSRYRTKAKKVEAEKKKVTGA